MKNGKGFLTRLVVALAVTAAVSTSNASAQRATSVSDNSASARQQQPSPQTKGAVVEPKPAPAPSTVKAKYEGGVVGYGKTDGTLSFDDVNSRLIFRDKTSREMFSVPYNVIMAAYADTQSRRPTAATVAANTVPYGLGLPALLFKKKHRYLTLQYRDVDTRAEGIASFKMGSKELLASVIYTLAEKSGLTQRGDAFVRQRAPTTVREVEPTRP